MNVLVDTSVWSIALRRSASLDDPIIQQLRRLIEESRAKIIGPIRQEILSDIREQAQYETLRDTLRSFPDLEITSADYERAADMFNLCRRQGLQGSNTDFLICALAERLDLAILTTDRDFQGFQDHIPLVLYPLGDES